MSERTPGDEELYVRARAIESLLLEKGLLADGAVERVVSAYETDIGPMLGARVVARAWTDPAYKERLLADAPAALEELGLLGFATHHLVVVENTATVHNVVVCTLCSCYPWGILGLPPKWYKDFAYRSRITLEPREVLREVGLELGPATEIRVWDSSADLRYMVLPERPAGTDGLTEDELAALVTRDAMVGIEKLAA